MRAKSPIRLCVLVLPGGRPMSEAASRPWQAANLRMALLATAVRRRVGSDVGVVRVRYRRRGWNSPALDAVADAQHALTAARVRFDTPRFVVVGHSMGGRVAVHLSGQPDVDALVALAPWWPDGDAELVPSRGAMLVIHGTADHWTSPDASRTQTERAHRRGVAAQWVGIDGAGHYMVRRMRRWHDLTSTFVCRY